MAPTKTELKRRWKDGDFVAALPFPPDKIPEQDQLQNVDLRGVPKLGNGGPLGWFKFHSVESSGVDLSFGDGVLNVYGSTLTDLVCREFKFDRASWFNESTFVRSEFTRSRLRLNVVDCEFHECVFDGTIFVGGFNEFGFRRCTFRDCQFVLADWQRTYLRACRFTGCDFTKFTISDSIVAGFKYESCIGFHNEMFVQCDVGGLEKLA
ncbi:pentapeptide repeat-containing protein [Bremerella sp. JC770]|uniref:pentapeptide repeat-containing protein n=1 Tax=Bremerella sp. JC770 TaxID=3232137 RepID=UPI00345A13C9